MTLQAATATDTNNTRTNSDFHNTTSHFLPFYRGPILALLWLGWVIQVVALSALPGPPARPTFSICEAEPAEYYSGMPRRTLAMISRDIRNTEANVALAKGDFEYLKQACQGFPALIAKLKENSTHSKKRNGSSVAHRDRSSGTGNAPATKPRECPFLAAPSSYSSPPVKITRPSGPGVVVDMFRLCASRLLRTYRKGQAASP